MANRKSTRTEEEKRAAARESERRYDERNPGRRERYAEANKERLKAERQARYQANREERLENQRIRTSTPEGQMGLRIRNAWQDSAVRDSCQRVTREEIDLLPTLCQVCGADSEQLDHIVPRSRGGCAALHNLQWVCKPCNYRKGSRLMHEWLPEGEYWAWADRTHSGGCIYVEVG